MSKQYLLCSRKTMLFVLYKVTVPGTLGAEQQCRKTTSFAKYCLQNRYFQYFEFLSVPLSNSSN